MKRKSQDEIIKIKAKKKKKRKIKPDDGSDGDVLTNERIKSNYEHTIVQNTRKKKNERNKWQNVRCAIICDEQQQPSRGVISDSVGSLEVYVCALAACRSAENEMNKLHRKKMKSLKHFKPFSIRLLK